jgi:hypothetical protein
MNRLITFDDDKVIIGFENSVGDLVYSIYKTTDGGIVIDDSPFMAQFTELAEDEGILEEIQEIN